MQNVYGVDAEVVCVGICYQPGPPFTHNYFSQWALDLMAEGFSLHGPEDKIVYRRDGDKVLKDNNMKGVTWLYVLVDEYDDMGRQLGVWPD